MSLSNPPLCDNCETEVADPSHYDDSWNNAGVQGEDGVYCSPTCRKEAEESVEVPIYIDEFNGHKSVSVKTSVSWTTISGVANKGFIPSSDLLEEINEKTIDQFEEDLDSYDTGEIGTAKILPGEQKVISVEVDL